MNFYTLLVIKTVNWGEFNQHTLSDFNGEFLQHTLSNFDGELG